MKCPSSITWLHAAKQKPICSMWRALRVVLRSPSTWQPGASRASRRGCFAKSTFSRAREQKSALTRIASKGRRAFEFQARLGAAPEFGQEIASHAGQQVIILERGLICDFIDQLQPDRRTEGHRQGNGAIQLHNW